MTRIPVFDIGDTLLPSHEKINETIRDELHKQGVGNPPKMPINEYNIYKPVEIQEWLEKNNIRANPDKIKHSYIKWETKFLKKNKMPVLKKINQEFGPIGFISDNSIPAKKFYKKLFEEENLNYKGFVVSEEVGVKKPNKKIFQEFLKIRQQSAEKFAYIGNYVDRDIGAKKIGMEFIWSKEYHVFDSRTYNGPQIEELNYKNLKNALRRI